MPLALRGLQFETEKGGAYYYDDCSGICYPCPSGLKETLLSLNSSPIEPLVAKAGALSGWEDFIVSRYRAYRAFFDADLVFPPIDAAALEEHLKTDGMRQLFLIVTSDCNLRCKYCVYSEHYPRTFDAIEHMSGDTAIAAVQYYLSQLETSRKAVPGKPAIINFYGGEPLLNFKVIEEVVEYVKRARIRNVVFSISTNALLLTDEIGDFLAANGFILAISMDGPSSEHDRNRVFPGGKGSFNAVYANVRRFRSRHPAHGPLVFLVTYDLLSNLDEIRAFFAQDEFRDAIFFFNSVRDIFTDYYAGFSKEEMEAIIRAATAFRQGAASLKERQDPWARYRISTQYFYYLMRAILAPPGHPEIPASATCIPGDKISVLPDGSFQACERIPGSLRLGDIRGGLNIPRVVELIENYNQAIVRSCQGCTVSRLCGFCYSHFFSGTAFEKPDPDFCKRHVIRTRIMLMELYSMLEESPDLYSAMIDRNARPYQRLNWLQG